MSYFIRIRGRSFGPFDEQELQNMKTQGKLSRSTEVSENRVDWQPAETYEFLFQPLPSLATSTAPGGSMVPQPPQEPTDWFYSVNGTDGYGPVTHSAIVQMFQTGKLQGDSLVWQEGQNAQPIRKVAAFSSLFPQRKTPPRTDRPTQNSSLFCAACGNPVVATAQMCPKCGSPVIRHRQQPRQFNSHGSTYDANAEGIGFFDVLTKKYAQFNGRARRKEYWMFMLFSNLIFTALIVLMFGFSIVIAGLAGGVAQNEDVAVGAAGLTMGIFGILLLIYGVYIFIPSLALAVRRLHDAGFSGWFFLVNLIPWIGGLIFFIFTVMDSQPGDNQYGPNPKGIDGPMY